MVEVLSRGPVTVSELAALLIARPRGVAAVCGC
jgi:hypothetical protein